MADIKTNVDLNKKRLSVELSAMRLNLERADLRLMELDDEKARINENKESTAKRIVELQEQLQETKPNG